MVNLSRPFACARCGKNIRIMYTPNGRRAVDEGILRVLAYENKYACHFLDMAGQEITGSVMYPGDRQYGSSVYAYRPHICKGKNMKKKARIPETVA